MKYNIFRLTFRQGIHIGNSSPDGYESSESFIRSDTMYAAITAVLAEVQDLASPFEPTFSLSSLFPYIKVDDQFEYFFPRPKIKVPFPDSNDLLEYRKEIKGFQWMGKSYFERLVNGHEFTLSEAKDNLNGSYFSEHNNFDKNYIYREIRDRVTVPRDGSDANPFVFEVMHFTKGSGLYFLCSEEGKKEVEKALTILKDRGLGTDRNLGFGHFDFEPDIIDLALPSSSKVGLSLGLLLPHNKNELHRWLTEINEKSDSIRPAYSLIKRGGWITHQEAATIRKGSIYMMEEGSILNISEIEQKFIPLILGRAHISLQPKKLDWKDLPPVLRCGKTIVLPINYI